MYKNAGKSWTESDKVFLSQCYAKRWSFAPICEHLGRSPLAIFCALEKQKLDPTLLSGWQSAGRPAPEDSGHRGTQQALDRVRAKVDGRQTGKLRELAMGYVEGALKSPYIGYESVAVGTSTSYEEHVANPKLAGAKAEMMIVDDPHDEMDKAIKHVFAPKVIHDIGTELYFLASGGGGGIKGLNALVDNGPGPAVKTATEFEYRGSHSGRWSSKNPNLGMVDAMREGVLQAKRNAAERATFSSMCPPPRALFGNCSPEQAAEAEYRRDQWRRQQQMLWAAPNPPSILGGVDFAKIEARIAAVMASPEPIKFRGVELFWDEATPYLNGPAIKPPKEKSTMKLFQRETRTLINGSPHTDEQLRSNAEGIARAIQSEDNQIKTLEAITTPTKALKKQIADRRANLAEFVAYVDSLEPSESTAEV